MKPRAGDPAPDFTAPVVGGSAADGAAFALSGMRGGTVVLVFYPRDATPGCTIQACAMRDGWSEIGKRARIFGVSGDGVKSHRRFMEKHDLPYPLISDEAHAIARAYGVWVEKSMMGKRFMGTERTTFVIDPDGLIQTVLEKASPSTHHGLLVEARA